MFSEFKETYLVISGKSIQAFKVLLGWSMDMTKRSNADRDRSRVSHDQAEEEKKSLCKMYMVNTSANGLTLRF